MVADEILKRAPKLSKQVLKPQMFMNRSGEAVKRYKPHELVVIHDDIDLPLGTIRVRKGGSSAGHKGVQSVIEALGTDLPAEALAKAGDFIRVRVGVSRPPMEVEPEQYVLQAFKVGDRELLKKTIDAAADLVLKSLESGKFEETTWDSKKPR